MAGDPEIRILAIYGVSCTSPGNCQASFAMTFTDASPSDVTRAMVSRPGITGEFGAFRIIVSNPAAREQRLHVEAHWK